MLLCYGFESRHLPHKQPQRAFCAFDRTCWSVSHDLVRRWDGTDGDWLVGVFHCDVINETLHGERESRRGGEVADKWGKETGMVHLTTLCIRPRRLIRGVGTPSAHT